MMPAEAGPVLDRIKATGKIVIAHRESSVPMSYLDADKQPVGYAMDLCARLALAVKNQLKLQSLKTEYLLVTSQSRIPAIAEGKADLECGSTTNNAERRKQVAFTIPHYVTGVRYMVRADSPIEQLAGFEQHKLVSTKGTTALKAVQAGNVERAMRITVLEAPDHGKAVDMVVKGEADGFAMDDILLYGLRAALPKPDAVKIVGKFLTIEPLAIMLSKDDAEFKTLVDNEMRRLIYSKEAYAIYDKWFQGPIPPNNKPLALPMNYLLRDFWKYPSDKVPF